MNEPNDKHNIRSSNYQVSCTMTTCWKCKKLTKVYGIMLPTHHEALESLFVDDTEDGTNPNDVLMKEWVGDQGEKVYYNIKAITNDVDEELLRISNGQYRMDRYNNSDVDTLMNHCEHCGIRQSEKQLNIPAESASSNNYAFAFITLSDSPTPIYMQPINKPFSAIGTKWISYGHSTIVEGDIEA